MEVVFPNLIFLPTGGSLMKFKIYLKQTNVVSRTRPLAYIICQWHLAIDFANLVKKLLN